MWTSNTVLNVRFWTVNSISVVCKKIISMLVETNKPEACLGSNLFKNFKSPYSFCLKIRSFLNSVLVLWEEN